MIIMKTPNEELQKAVLKDSERLHKEAEEAFEANKKEAEEIEKYHGKDTKKAVSNKQLKAMHLSEALFEDLNEEESSNFRSDIYYAIQRVCYNYRFDGVSPEDLDEALEWAELHFREDEDFDECFLEEETSPKEIPGFEGTWDKLSELNFGESLTEELSQQGQKVLNELKKELGPELQKKVAFVIKDYASKENKKEVKGTDTEEEQSEL